MKNKLYNNKPFINIYEKPLLNSNISSQILFGEKFKIIEKTKKFYRIITDYDKYKGYILKSKFNEYYKPSHKVNVLKARVYKLPNQNSISNYFLPFSSEIEIIKKDKNFVKVEKNMWIKQSCIISKNKKRKDYKKIYKLFSNCKYLWGGKTYNGIDCSALVQIYYKYNNNYFPRDTKDQIKFKRGKLKTKFVSGDIIFWKGHVAVCINNKHLIHAYGPKKKVIIMPIEKTIRLIKNTANLKIQKIFSI